jgi:hypothetical protein
VGTKGILPFGYLKLLFNYLGMDSAFFVWRFYGQEVNSEEQVREGSGDKPLLRVAPMGLDGLSLRAWMGAPIRKSSCGGAGQLSVAQPGTVERRKQSMDIADNINKTSPKISIERILMAPGKTTSYQMSNFGALCRNE